MAWRGCSFLWSLCVHCAARIYVHWYRCVLSLSSPNERMVAVFGIEVAVTYSQRGQLTALLLLARSPVLLYSETVRFRIPQLRLNANTGATGVESIYVDQIQISTVQVVSPAPSPVATTPPVLPPSELFALQGCSYVLRVTGWCCRWSRFECRRYDSGAACLLAGWQSNTGGGGRRIHTLATNGLLPR